MNAYLIREAGMYAAYHRDRRNIATHVVGVPTIVLSIVLALHAVPLGGAGSGLTLGWVVAAGFAVFYLWLQPLAGGLLGAALLAAAYASAPWTGWSPLAFWGLVAALFVGGWALQLVGHAFEGRKPALADNLLQIFVAPIFLVLEALFALGLLAPLKQAIATASLRHAPAAREAAPRAA